MTTAAASDPTGLEAVSDVGPWLDAALATLSDLTAVAAERVASWLASVGEAVAAHRLEVAVLAGFLLLAAVVMLLRRPRGRGGDRARDLGGMTRGTRVAAFLVLATFAGLGGGWAVMAPLASAAVATGVVSPEGARRSVQHLEGGIIRAIHVRDGDRVSAGDPLVTLEDVRARADNQVLLDRRAQLRAEIARLQAEQVMAEEMRLPADLRPARLEPDQASTVRAQLQLFDGRRATLDSRRSVLTQRIRQLEEENSGLRAAIDGLNEQLGLIGQEIDNVQTLFDRGLARMPRLLELQRTRAQVRIELAQNRASIARNLQRIGETEIEAAKLDEEWRERAATELAEARAELAEVESKLSKTQDALRRTTIAAPVGGVVVELAFTTVGGVVKAGERILDIVPRDSELLIDARVTPQDIDDVFPGLEAQVVLSAYNQRNMPEVRGRIRTVSADRLVDERTGEAYYLARVEVPKEQLQGLGQEIELIPGMPAEVMILTGNHTFFDYLIDPVVKSFNRSFRES